MTAALWILGSSTVLLLTFSSLFWYEGKRGERFFLAHFRNWVDTKLTKVGRSLSSLASRFGQGSLRVILHFFVHVVLDFLLKILNWFTNHLGRLQRRNKNIAKAVREERDKNHLSIIAEHKASTSLSEAEKQDLKDKSIGV